MNDQHSSLTKNSKLCSGIWDENTSWEFYLSDTLPPRELCTAVFCLGIYQNSIVLTKTQRGWELPGGHREEDERIEEALVREAMEEGGGIVAEQYKVFGYRKITVKKPIPRRDGSGFYPHPYSYIPHYIVITETKPKPPTGEEVLESKSFPLHEVDIIETSHLKIIRAGLEELERFRSH